MVDKKNIRPLLTLVLLSIIALSSCKKFVTKDPFNQIDEDLAITNLSQAKYALAGMYDGLQHNTYYGRNFIAMGDAPTDNVIIPANNSGRMLSEGQWTMSVTNADLSDFWNKSYECINRANKLIDALAKINSTDSLAQQYLGEAMAYRAMVHFDLVRFFAQPYDFTPDASHYGVPYMDYTTVNGLPGRDSVSVVYAKAIKDLQGAAQLLRNEVAERPFPFVFSKNAAKALLARIYLYKGDFAKSRSLAIDVINSGAYSLVGNSDYVDSWLLGSSPESILSVSNSPTDYMSTNSLGYLYLQVGYGDLRVPQSFKALFDKNDVRLSLFTQGTGSQSDWTFVGKYPSRENTTGLSSDPIIRLSEMYLIAAEACAKTNDEANAINYLDAIRLRADPTASRTTKTGEQLVGVILAEKRKELCYEGHYFHDLKRLHLTITSALRSDNKPYLTITYPDNKLAYPIPDREILANPVIAKQQNPQ